MRRGVLVGGLLWSLAVAGVGGVAASGAVEGLGPADQEMSGTPTTVVQADPAATTVAVAPPPESAVAVAPTTAAPVDRTAEYIDAIVADSMEGLDESARPVVTCVSEGILSALGGAAALEQAGVTPQLLGVADDLTELGIPIDPGVTSAIAASAAQCGLGPFLADVIVDGFAQALGQVGSALFGGVPEDVLDPADRECLVQGVGADGRVVEGFAIGYGTGDNAAADGRLSAALGDALTNCAHTFVPFFIQAASAAGLTPTPDSDACIEREVTARSARLAAAMVGGDIADAQAASNEVFQACEPTFGP